MILEVLLVVHWGDFVILGVSMKRFIYVLSVFFLVFFMTGCVVINRYPKGDLYLGVNCEIKKVNRKKKTIVISGIDDEARDILGNELEVDCSGIDMLEVEDSNPKEINLSDLKAGDRIAVGLYKGQGDNPEEKKMPEIKSVQKLD